MAIVREKQVTRTDGLIVTEISMHRPKKKGIKAGDRKGFNSRSGMASMLDPELAEIEKPTVDKVVPLITKLRIIGDISESDHPKDVLTAQGHALYEFLMAAARIQGIVKDEYRVLLRDAKKFLGIKHNDRLRALGQQLQDTTVEYDFTIDGERWEGLKMPLLLVDYVTTLQDGKTYLVYSIQPHVKRVITEARQWAKLDINAYPKFQCKYTARLYPRFQLISQYHEAQRNNWIVSPIELAKMAGFVFTGDFHYGNFEKGLLKPVLKDIETHATMLNVEIVKVHRKPGRGNPVDKIEFNCEPRSYLRPIGDSKMRMLSPLEFDSMTRELYKDETVVHDFMPPHDLLLKAAYRLDRNPFELLKLWKDDIAKAFAYPSMELHLFLRGQAVCDLLETKGSAAAFEFWAGHIDEVPDRLWAITEKEFDLNIGRETWVETDPVTGYTGTVGRIRPACHSTPVELSEADRIAAELLAITDDELDHDHRIEQVKQYCSAVHPAFKTRLYQMEEDDFDEVEIAMKLASIARPTPIERRDFIVSICRLISQPRSDKTNESLRKIAATFRMKHQRSH
ncbi:hypothetical protein ASG42_11245 [Rhizobium sp. Leaf391]|uniref:replication initiation protein n=1 Tax=Rhizobium sp. Leaf391 TaxID=1736360 RepID=UPI00071308A6|nr:replication initiation protein [Rhizobium sp. Leaf391]KQS91059.1 hypothetical protein ASG42_11245 [Rhizobium sp. Leaf391]